MMPFRRLRNDLGVLLLARDALVSRSVADQNVDIAVTAVTLSPEWIGARQSPRL
jgi:hypothetical protein